METSSGLSNRRASAKASSPHSHQSTGLSLCCRRYGLVAPASRLAILTTSRMPTSVVVCPKGTVRQTKQTDGPLPGDSADSARFRVTTRFVRTPCPAVTAPTILSPADLDPRHVFLGPAEVFLRYGWKKSKGYEMLQAPGFPRRIGGKYRFDTSLAWEERALVGPNSPSSAVAECYEVRGSPPHHASGEGGQGGGKAAP